MMWGWMGWWGWTLMLAWWALVVVGIVWLVRSLSGGDPTSSSSDSARRILDERFARGELSAEEYNERRETLRLR